MLLSCFFFFFNDTATTEIYTLSLHDALPISRLPKPTVREQRRDSRASPEQNQIKEPCVSSAQERSEEHTSELQSPCNLVCRLLLEKKKNKPQTPQPPDLDHELQLIDTNQQQI